MPASGQAVGVYRLLRGLGDTSRGVTFSANPPVAVAPSTYNGVESDSTQIRVAYGSGMTQFCATCHPDFLTNAPGHSHPVDASGVLTNGDEATNYNAYIMSGNMTGVIANAWNSLVPFEIGNSNGTLAQLATLATTASKVANLNGTLAGAGASTGAQVMCLTCHRAHATGFNHMTRWYNDTEMMVTNSTFVNITTGYMSGAEAQAAYYGRTAAGSFASYQRSLCNKCHAKD